MPVMRKVKTDMSLYTASIEEEVAKTPRHKKTIPNTSRTSARKEQKKTLKIHMKDRSPLAINFATNESNLWTEQSMVRSGSSTAKPKTTKAVQDSNDGHATQYSIIDENSRVIKERKYRSFGPEYRKISQSLMMQEMYDRLSGYDYKYEVDSRVSKCSFNSFKLYKKSQSAAFNYHAQSKSDDEETSDIC